MTSSVFTLFTNSGDDAPVGMILGIVFGVIGFILLVGIIAFCCRKRALKKKQEG
jgi:threonine/homoserine/homoserine lactone efflux protein